jgi:cytochrome c553
MVMVMAMVMVMLFASRAFPASCVALLALLTLLVLPCLLTLLTLLTLLALLALLTLLDADERQRPLPHQTMSENPALPCYGTCLGCHGACSEQTLERASEQGGWPDAAEG